MDDNQGCLIALFLVIAVIVCIGFPIKLFLDHQAKIDTAKKPLGEKKVKADILFHPSAETIAPDAILEYCKGQFKELVVIGETKEGEFVSMGGGGPSNERVLWWLEVKRKRIMLEVGE